MDIFSGAQLDMELVSTCNILCLIICCLLSHCFYYALKIFYFLLMYNKSWLYCLSQVNEFLVAFFVRNMQHEIDLCPNASRVSVGFVLSITCLYYCCFFPVHYPFPPCFKWLLVTRLAFLSLQLFFQTKPKIMACYEIMLNFQG